MAAVLVEEVTYERLGATLTAGCDHEGVLELTDHAADVEHAVAAPHAFKIDRANMHPRSKQEVSRRGVAVQPHLPILPHTHAAAPQVP
jgi:hypothetical protein